MQLVILFIVLLIQLAFNFGQDMSDEEKILFTYSHNIQNTSYNKDFIVVHAIPHSHDDVGWLRTFDEYYNGSNQTQSYQQTNVSKILNSVFKNLIAFPTHTFTFSELAYFQRWYDNISEKDKQKVKKLIKNEQIEFVSGGWVQNDEACTQYEDIIDQMITGHQFLYENFELVPNIGWQMDPFGHSKSQAYLFKQMGFDAFFMGRIDIYEEFQLLQDNMMKFIWKIDNKSNIFSELFFLRYVSPLGFEFDQRNHGENGKIQSSNLDRLTNNLVYYIKNVSLHYPGQNFIQLFGDDFTYEQSEYNFRNLSLLFDNINKHKDHYKMQINFSTPMRYLKALQKEKIDFRIIKNQDFFPYRDVYTGFWSGFYSSRPITKGFIIRTGRYLHNMRGYMLYEFLNQRRQFDLDFQFIKTSIRELERAKAIQQHHDCITGTSTEYVSDDYKRILLNGIDKFNDALLLVLRNRTQFDIEEQVEYQLYEVSVEDSLQPDDWIKQRKIMTQYISQNSNILITIYNPAIILVRKILRLIVNDLIFKYTLINEHNEIIKSEYVCPLSQPSDECYLFFDVKLKPMEMNYFKLIFTNNQHNIMNIQISGGNSVSLEDQELIFIKQTPYKQNRYFQYNQRNFQIRYGYYESYGNIQQNEGVYIFKPNPQFNQSQTYKSAIQLTKPTIFQGQLFSYIFFFTKELNLGLLLTKYSNHIQIESKILEINLQYKSTCKDIVLEVSDQSLNNNNEFFTDENGLFIELRKKKGMKELIAGDYYPVTRLIMIKDKDDQNKRLVLFNDRSQGGSSIVPSSVELMIARRIGTNDNRGMPEILDNNWNHTQFHYLFFDLNDEEIRNKQVLFDLHPQIFVGQSSKNEFQYHKTKIKKISNIEINYHIKPTLRHWTSKEGHEYFILRLQNTLEVTQNLDYQWDDILIVNQTTLTGNKNLQNLTRLEWCYESKCDHNQKIEYIQQKQLKPLSFQTFIVQSSNKSKRICPYGFFVMGNKKCARSCPAGWQPNYTNFTCDKNINCPKGFVYQQLGGLQGECMNECFKNFWRDDEDNICYPCNTNCKECLNIDKCKICNKGFQLDSNGLCTKEVNKKKGFFNKQVNISFKFKNK